MGHLGLTPQSVLAMGGFKVQARNIAAADALLDAAKSLEAAGCFAFVIEGVPDVVGAAVTEAVGVPTIGIGAGPACDGQVMVFHDLLGLGAHTPPKFVRQYAEVGRIATEAIAAFADDVRGGDLPERRRELPRLGRARRRAGLSAGRSRPGPAAPGRLPSGEASPPGSASMIARNRPCP